MKNKLSNASYFSRRRGALLFKPVSLRGLSFWNEGNKVNYQVDHSTTAFLIDPEGRIKVMFDAVKDATSVANMFQENKELFNS